MFFVKKKKLYLIFLIVNKKLFKSILSILYIFIYF